MSVLYRVEDSWCRYFPLLHRLLADPLSEELFPPAAASLRLNEACAVWETLHYLLCVLLGWDDPGTGLSWWYAHGKPVANSPLLAAVSRWWGRDEGALDLYAAWAWNRAVSTSTEMKQGRPSPRQAGMRTRGGGRRSGGDHVRRGTILTTAAATLCTSGTATLSGLTRLFQTELRGTWTHLPGRRF